MSFELIASIFVRNSPSIKGNFAPNVEPVDPLTPAQTATNRANIREHAKITRFEKLVQKFELSG
ncbi:MAG: hypothetical protein KIS76_14510 [Pyrinomonadaceae bacterium]|nr:hypothetical protein [Pyrinomonadaceae bacterium]